MKVDVANIDNFQDMIKTTPPKILHFICHGDFDLEK